MRGQTFQAPRHPAVPHRQDGAHRGAQGDARAATRDRAAARRARRRRPKRPGARTWRCASSCARRTTTSPSWSSRRGASLDAVDHPGGPLTQRTASDIAAHLGFTLHYVPDLPQTTRGRWPTSRTAASTCRAASTTKGDPRTAVLQALSSRDPGSPRADVVRRLPAPARGDELPHRRPAHPRGARGAVPAGGQEGPRRSRSKICATPTRCRTRPRRTASRTSRPCTSGMPVHFLKVHESGVITKVVRERRRQLPDRPPGRDRGADVLPQVDLARRLRRRRPLQPVLPVHRHRQRHLLVHGACRAVERRGALGQRRRAVRRHQVVPRARHPQPRRLDPLGRGVLPPRARPTWRPPGASTRGRTCAPRARCWRHCRPAPSPASTPPTCTSSSRRTPPLIRPGGVAENRGSPARARRRFPRRRRPDRRRSTASGDGSPSAANDGGGASVAAGDPVGDVGGPRGAIGRCGWPRTGRPCR